MGGDMILVAVVVTLAVVDRVIATANANRARVLSQLLCFEGVALRHFPRFNALGKPTHALG